MLTELDVLEELRGVIVIAASNRPDIVGRVLIRPGRFDRLLYVPPPDRESRLQIIKIHTKKTPLALDDINLEHLADITVGYTGADISSFISAAIMLALREYVSKYDENPVEAEKHAKEELKVHMRHFEEAMKKTKPLSNQELDWYANIAEQFTKRPSTIARTADEIKGGIG